MNKKFYRKIENIIIKNRLKEVANL